MDKLNRAFEAALASTLKSCNIEQFSKSFPSQAGFAPETIQAIHSQITDFLESSIQDEYKTIVQKCELSEKLDQFHQSITEKEENPLFQNYSAKDIIAGQVLNSKKAQLEQLNQELAQLNQENNHLKNYLSKQKMELKEGLGFLSELEAEWSEAVQIASKDHWTQ